jgi:hypothetical protein
VLTALLRPGVGTYSLPPWLWTKRDAKSVFWSVEALDENGDILSKSEWRTIVRGSDGQP